MSKESSLYGYYYMVNAEYDEAKNMLIEMIPQFTLELSDAGDKYKGILGMYQNNGAYTSIAYNSTEGEKGVIYSMNGETHYINPMITILSLSYLHAKTETNATYCFEISL